MTEQTLKRCRCDDPVFPKAYLDGSGRVYMACHHCDRPCGSSSKSCPRCTQSSGWEPYKGYRDGVRDW